MKRILIVITAIALAAISYGPGRALQRTAHQPGGSQSLIVMVSEVVASSGAISSGRIYLCADNGGAKDDSDDKKGSGKKGSGDEEKSEKDVPGIDRIWDVVLYG
jgi:hypothetical protein